jgi:predicted lysophospholipase L1 biosynthesis ABC-type transport system permease subunit
MADREIIRESSGGGMTAVLIALALIVAGVLGYMYVSSESRKNDAITGAAQAVGDAAQDAGDAVKPSN